MSEPWFTHNTGNQPCVCPFCKQEAALRAARERIEELEARLEYSKTVAAESHAASADWIERAVRVLRLIEWSGYDRTTESELNALLREREGK